MYLIRYTLHVGSSQHYAPSAKAGAALVREIRAGGGRLGSITRTRDNRVLTVEELQGFADAEIGPPDNRRSTLLSRLRQLLEDRRSLSPPLR